MNECLTPSTVSSLKLEIHTVLRLCELIDTPRSLAVYLLVKNSEFQQYLDLDLNASLYEDVSNFADDYLVTEILRKSPNLPLDIDRKAVALSSFIDSEFQCYLTNVKLNSISPPEWFHPLQRNLLKILGPLTTDDINYVDDSMRHGPGATTGIRGFGSVTSDKYDEEIHLTAGLIPFYRSILGENWWEHQRHCSTIVDGNKFITVPKSAKTDRGICVEPTLNMYVQLGIGALLRKRLIHFGVDLNSQEKNRTLAKRAWADNLCTIDLSAASDSFSSDLILRLFPERWQELILLPRSGFCTLPNGESIELEKISSMGNGYTFELETLLFFAVCKTFIPKKYLHQVSVYGDDIICPQRYARAVIDALNYLGFRVNTSKSYLAGNFYESCGSDWFKGQNVRPFYLRGGKKHIPYTVQIANSLRLYAKRLGDPFGCDERFRSLWLELYKATPQKWRNCLVPEEFGDSGFIVSFEEARRTLPRTKNEHHGYFASHMVFQPVVKRKTSNGVLLRNLERRVSSLQPHDRTLVQYVRDDGTVSAIRPSLFTRGAEPKRGFLRQVVPRRSQVFTWTDGLGWIVVS